MKRTKFFTRGITLLFAWVMLFTSCSKDDPVEPTVQLTAEVDGYEVTLTVEATDAVSYLWDYGDGKTSTTSGSHTYTYVESGDYTITVTVTSADDLTASETVDVTITASLEEMIAGVGDAGRAWVLTQAETSFSGGVGVGLLTDDVALVAEWSTVVDGLLTVMGLGDEYTDEFTFYRDGTFKIDTKNGRGLAGVVYANIVSPNDKTQSNDPAKLPLASIPFANVDNASWELSYEDKTVEWYDWLVAKSLKSTTFTFPENGSEKIAELKISSGAYLAVNDLYYPDPIATAMGLPAPVDNSFYILKSVSTEAMYITVCINSYPNLPHLASVMLHLTLVPKQ